MSIKVKDGASTGATAAPPKRPRPGKSGSSGQGPTMNLPRRHPAPQRDKAPRPHEGAPSLPLPCQMIAEAGRHVVGQTRATRAVAAALYRHFLLLSAATESGVPPRPGRVLLIGPTGVGKTLLIKALARFLGVPFVYVSATTLVQSGYVGKKPEDILSQLLQAAGGDIERAQRGIVLLDEIDKLKRNDDVFGLDVSGYGAQVDLLPFLDGTDVTVQRDNTTYRFDTRRLFVVAAGAFEGIERITERRLQEGAGFGFGTPGTGRENTPGRVVAEDLTPEDLVRYGLCEEFVGRFSAVCTLDPLGADDLRTILLEAQSSPLAEARAYFALHGVELEFDEAAIDAIVARAINQGTARGPCRGSCTRCWPIPNGSSRSCPAPASVSSPWRSWAASLRFGGVRASPGRRGPSSSARGAACTRC